MKNYGAKLDKIREMFPDKTIEEAIRIDESYYKAFPGVKAYHNYCWLRAREFSYTENLFGVKYYGLNGHKLINTLIQGTAAYFLKWKMRQAYDFCKEKGLKTKYQMNIHDELSWLYHRQDPLNIFFEFKGLMEYWEDSYVPIVADMEITTTTWKDKKEVSTLHELQENLST